MVPVLEDIAGHLEQITRALSPDTAGHSIAEEVRSLYNFLQNEMGPLVRKLEKKQ